MRIAFDVDGTLIRKSYTGRDVPRHDVIDLLNWFIDHGHTVFVWSGGGADYASEWVEKLGLETVAGILSKYEYHNIDLCFDDEEVELAKLNFRV